MPRPVRKRKRPERYGDFEEDDELPQKKEKEEFGLEWKTVDTCYILTSSEIKGSKKIAAFDLVN